ncbi:protein dj-1beta-like [Condylostylus longicornis]|uniref:protein dj-1beta-like n=1 Tax=Condylostylus longicornis TaxID=2530218 RepID=UPI00244DDF9D|nr:protein dj-1beta-like [Condylostylus longicornis]
MLRTIFTRAMSSKSALVILAPGAEEMEFVISADVLRRAGIQVTVAGLENSEVVKCSREVIIKPDASLEDVKNNDFDVIVLPGGLGGAKAFASSKIVGELLKKQESANKIIAAICAAPIAFDSHDIGLGKKITSYPAFKDQLSTKFKYIENESVVKDGNFITSRGPGTAFDFALKIAEELNGADKAKEVAKAMLLA